jgi:DNA repair protein SbcC/Rad50
VRLHRLELQAFGPFAGRESVDVDALAEQGLFLLHGPTGAGKTSVLDAVCLALFGRVPGARGSGTRLRSDHAAQGLAPQVLVELTVGGRRFEVTRSPAWDRPKKRGDGVTTEPARTLLRERVDGGWVPVTSRNDEAAQLLTDVLGMGLEQFTKVVLLPQGEFAAFLRAPAEERRPLLQRLFATDRFADVETWLAEQRRVLGRQLEQADVSLDRLLARVDQVAAALPADTGTPSPATSLARKEEATGEEEAVERSRRSWRWAASVAGERRQSHAEATLVRDAVRRRQEELAAEVGRADRLSIALAERNRLAGQTVEMAAGERALEKAMVAATVAGDLRAVESCRRALVTGTLELSEALQALCDLGVEVERGASPAELGAAAHAAREEVGRLDDLLALEATVSEISSRRDRLRADLAARRERGTELERQRAVTRTRLQQHQSAGELLAAQAADADAARRGVADAEAVLEAATRCAELRRRAGEDEGRLTVATDAAQATRQRWLDLRERRLAGMAAELAGALEPGRPCAVCGSEEHPRPATSTGVSVSEQDERESQSAAERAAELRAESERQLTATRQALAVQQELSGGVGVDTARTSRTQAVRRLTAAERACADRDCHRTEAEKAARRYEQLTEEASRTAGEVASVAAKLDEVGASLVEAEGRLRAARGDDDSIAARRSRLLATATALETARSAAERQSAAEVGYERSVAEAKDAIRSVGFGSLDAASAAVQDAGEVKRLTDLVQQHRTAWAAVHARLAEDDLQRAGAERAARKDAGVLEDVLRAQLGDVEGELARADAQVEQANADLVVAEGAAEALGLLTEQVAAEVAATAPLRERHDLVADLARCAEGTGGGNALRMRLSSYVLAARLEHVAAAATVRLDEMSGGRYSLVHTDTAERGGRRSGLGLEVVDAWTGRQRDTSSLSGGESFLASLALALGLADVVQAEAGGTAIETLFVDEGFGTLDSETLEEVMAVLDGLRDGGRSVGLISHVAELRSRIPSRLEVVKTRTGSHLRSSSAGAAGAA